MFHRPQKRPLFGPMKQNCSRFALGFRTFALSKLSRAALVCAVMLVAVASSGAAFKILVFSKTAAFRHDSITNGLAAIRQLGTNNTFEVVATENSADFNEANLAQFAAVIFLSTT